MRTLVAAHEPSEPKRADEWPLAGRTTTVLGRSRQMTADRTLNAGYRWINLNVNSKTEVFN